MYDAIESGQTIIKAILIDDEAHCNHTLAYELGRHCPDVQILKICTSGKQGLEAIRLQNPDVVFLDIEMPGMSGFDMLADLDDINFSLIFVTAYDHFALQAFRFSAIDYLLKPVVAQELMEAVQRAMQKKNAATNQAHLEILWHNLDPWNKNNPRIALPTSDGHEFVSVSEIIRCQAQSNYSCIFLKGKRRLLLSKTLKEVEHWLAPYRFIRCHQSHLINVNEVQRFIRRGASCLVMTDNTQVPISRGKIKECLVKFAL